MSPLGGRPGVGGALEADQPGAGDLQARHGSTQPVMGKKVCSVPTEQVRSGG